MATTRVNPDHLPFEYGPRPWGESRRWPPNERFESLLGDTARPSRSTRCVPRRPGVVGSPGRAIRTLRDLAARSRRKDASYPNSDNRLFTTSTDESSDSRRRVWFRYADRAGRVAFDGAARTSMGERHAVRTGANACPAGAARSLMGCRSLRALRATPPRARRFRPCLRGAFPTSGAP